MASLRSAMAISEQEHVSMRAAAAAETEREAKEAKLQAPRSQQGPEPSVGHSSQPLMGGAPGGSRHAAATGAKRPSPSGGSKAAAAPPRKRAARGGEAAAVAAPSPTGPAPRAAAGQVDLDPLVGRVVLRHWPNDGGWFRGIISDYRNATGDHW
jgi:hypothetical protein